MKVNRSVFLLALALLGGCSGKDSSSTAEPPATAPPLVEKAGLGIPEELVNDGLKAMGYPFDKEIEYEVTGFPLGSTSTQTLTMNFEGKDGQNVLTFEYAGEPTSLPTESYSLEADAIYGISAGGGTITPKVKAMPATITMGDSWPTKGSLNDGGVTMDTVVKIVGREKVTVRAGEFDAIVMTETGTIKIGTNPTSKVEGKSWYVEGIGAVKRTISQTDSAGKTSNLTIEAVSIK